MTHLCRRLGRPSRADAFLDRLGRALTGLPARRAWRWDPVFLASGPELDFVDGGRIGDAPDKPHAMPGNRITPGPRSVRDIAEHLASTGYSSAFCAQPKYQGMHGRPCALVGGTDLRCPPGAKMGWFWRYRTKLGIYYYVDCCGTVAHSPVYCNWTNEDNWCSAAGWNHGSAAWASKDDEQWETYTCTLAVPDALMRTGVTEASAEGRSFKHFHVIYPGGH